MWSGSSSVPKRATSNGSKQALAGHVRLAAVLDYAANPEKTTKAKSKYSNADYQALRDVVNYVKDSKKTEQELFCQGINCNPSTAREQFVTVKEQFDKPDGIQAYHGYLSFKETDITPELAQHIGMEFANSVWGKRHQVLVTTHLNTEHLHCHFVINSVSFVDGKRCRETSWFKFLQGSRPYLREVRDQHHQGAGALPRRKAPDDEGQGRYAYKVQSRPFRT